MTQIISSAPRASTISGSIENVANVSSGFINLLYISKTGLGDWILIESHAETWFNQNTFAVKNGCSSLSVTVCILNPRLWLIIQGNSSLALHLSSSKATGPVHLAPRVIFLRFNMGCIKAKSGRVYAHSCMHVRVCVCVCVQHHTSRVHT